MAVRTKDQKNETLELKRNIEDYLLRTGRPLKKPFKCVSGTHEDRHPSMSYDPKALNVHCFSCGASYDLIDLIGIDYGIKDKAEMFAKARDLYGRTGQTGKRWEQRQEPLEDLTPFFLQAHQNIGKTDYTAKRGLNQETITRFNLGYVEGWRHPKAPKTAPTTNRLIIPTGKSSYTARDTDPEHTKYIKQKVGSAGLFNADALGANNPVFVVEGEIDAMSIEQAGGRAVALGSMVNKNKLFDACDRIPPKQTLIIALDNEDTPQIKKNLEDIKSGLAERNISYWVAPNNVFGDYKDANEALVQGGEHALKESIDRAIEESGRAEEDVKKEYIDAYAGGSNMLRFMQALENGENDEPTSTGFTNLDKLIDGGLYPGLYIIGAVPSLGKTAFVCQMADTIAKNGEHALMVALEMSTQELIARSLSRITAELDPTKNTIYAETDRRILRGGKRSEIYSGYTKEENDLFYNALGEYAQYANNIFYREGMGNVKPSRVREFVQEHISKTGKKPVLFIDYLQVLQPENERSTDKQNTDYAILELKRISRDFNIPVVAITSFNREGYKKKADMTQAKESGAIEYGCDVMLGMQVRDYDPSDEDAIDEEKRKDVRALEVKVLKNRHGKPSTLAFFNFYAKFYLFREDGEEI